ncbi:MAG: hypothetical protein AAGH57_04615 [Pseudomonadota bacterium]
MSFTRRHALVFAIGSASLASSVLSGRVLAAKKVVCPTSPMLLRRELSRGLRDGKAIVVTREWRVEFVEHSRGISVSGLQTRVFVDAPPALAKISEIEKARSTQDMFPILLSQNGMILAAGKATSRASVEAAIAAAADLMAKKGLSVQTVSEQRQFLMQLQQTGSSLLEQMPGDLFFPMIAPVREIREITLPSGVTGEFEVMWSANAHTETGLLDRARREVITRINESERRSSETWTLRSI